jgi:hypothetical protein
MSNLSPFFLQRFRLAPTAPAVLLAGTLLMPSMVAAQTILGTVQGYVGDLDGRPLAGAEVSLLETATGARRSSRSDDRGFFTVKGLQPGLYRVATSYQGVKATRETDVPLGVAQILDVELRIDLAAVAADITVTGTPPLVETSRSGAASYIDSDQIRHLPIVGRDFKQFATLAATVQEGARGSVTMSGQREIYTGFSIDGADAKSAFFGYGLGGEATGNHGLVVAQESVREFQVVTSGFGVDRGRDGGGYVNVVTRSGTNDLKGSAFYFFRDESMVEDIPPSPLLVARGIGAAREPDEFERQNWGVSLGGPIRKDRTHFFFAWDQTRRTEPFVDNLQYRGAYDAILLRAQNEPAFTNLVDGYLPNEDGIPAPDPLLGRTATGLFLGSVDNLILFTKVGHQLSETHSLSLRYNFSDFEGDSTWKDDLRLVERTDALVASLVSVLGSRSLNEARLQYVIDDLERLPLREGEPIQAQLWFRDGGFDTVGKGVFGTKIEETKVQLHDTFSRLVGEHDLDLGVDYQRDRAFQRFAPGGDGIYEFRSPEDFLANRAFRARFYFGEDTFDEYQTLVGAYAQDTWRPSANLSLELGIRWDATFNPDDLEHLRPDARDIPDDRDNLAPRFGFAWSPGGGRSVLRGGIGLFFARTPTLLFFNQVVQNGIFPNFGLQRVFPGQPGFVPLGEEVDNANPPSDLPLALSWVDPEFEDTETRRLSLGYERELSATWAGGVDLLYAEGKRLHANFDINRTVERLDEFGRPIYASARPDPDFGDFLIRRSIAESDYRAVTLSLRRRFSGRYSLQGHYTWSRDKDTDSNERSAFSVTVSNNDDIGYDRGLSDGDVEHRLVVTGRAELPAGLQLSGIVAYRSGIPWTPLDPENGLQNYPGGNGPDPRAVIDGVVAERNSRRNESIRKVDLRLSKLFAAGRLEIEVFAEVFNLFDDHSFRVTGSRREPTSRSGEPNPGFGIPSAPVSSQRQFQLGVRLSY